MVAIAYLSNVNREPSTSPCLTYTQPLTLIMKAIYGLWTNDHSVKIFSFATACGRIHIFAAWMACFRPSHGQNWR
jgi:hypothetical protein